MARQARIVLTNNFHHIYQRADNGAPLFFEKEDYATYLNIIQEQADNYGLKIYSYCLLPTQIHLLIKPQEKENLARGIGETNRQYTRHINEKYKLEGNLFQNRFFSYVVDEQHALRAARFIEILPLTARITDKAQNFLWSSARYRIKLMKHDFLQDFQNFHMAQNWEDYLSRPIEISEMETIQRHLQTGRPRGSNMFLDNIEQEIGRTVRPKKRGRKPKQQQA